MKNLKNEKKSRDVQDETDVQDEPDEQDEHEHQIIWVKMMGMPRQEWVNM